MTIGVPEPWIFIGIFVAFGLVIGCVALFPTNEAVSGPNREQEAHAITSDQFAAIALGTSRAGVIAQLGTEPADEELVVEGVLDDADVGCWCIYYNRCGHDLAERYQFCFDGDSLRSKKAYEVTHRGPITARKSQDWSPSPPHDDRASNVPAQSGQGTSRRATDGDHERGNGHERMH